MNIIRNSADLCLYVEINASSKFQFFQPSVRIAERRYLSAVLGAAMFATIADYIMAPANKPEYLKPVADLAQEAVANIALAMSVTRLSAAIDENGVRRNETEKVKTAFQYQEINLRESYVSAGFDAIDELLAVLEASPELYPEWADSSAYKDYKKYFMQSGQQFSQSFDIRNARYTYMSLRSTMRRVEDFELKPALGKKLFDAIKAQLLAGTLTAEYEGLLDNFIRPAVAILTIARAVVEKSVDVTDFGVSTNIIQDNSNSQQKQPAPLDKIKEVAQQLREDGNKYLADLSEELVNNPFLYPDYEAIVLDRPLINFPNKQDNSFLAV